MNSMTLPLKQSGDIANCVETLSGRLVDLLNPLPEQVVLEDIATSLARIPRFVGHTSQIYSVASHSIHVAELVHHFLFDDQVSAPVPMFNDIAQLRAPIKCLITMHALLHDAHEAYIGDIPSPLKRQPEIHAFVKQIEAGLDRAIHKSLGVDHLATPIGHKLIKHCDGLAQVIEGRHFMASGGALWNLPQPAEWMVTKFSTDGGNPIKVAQTFIRYFQAYSDK